MWCLRFLVLSSILTCLCILKPTVFTIRQTSAAIIPVCLFGALRFNFMAANYLILANISLYIVQIWLIVIFILTCWWGYKLYQTRKDWMAGDYPCLLYWCLLFFTSGGPVVFNFFYYFHKIFYPNIPIANEYAFIYIYTATAVIISVIPGQIARYNAITSSNHIISTKQAYIRYISHELRTPMNIIEM
jgi:hypothetical protein